MASRLVVTWECDRCYATTEGYQPMFQPLGWYTARLTNPPKGTPDEALTRKVTLCTACQAAFWGWVASGAHIDGSDDAGALTFERNLAAHNDGQDAPVSDTGTMGS